MELWKRKNARPLLSINSFIADAAFASRNSGRPKIIAVSIRWHYIADTAFASRNGAGLKLLPYQYFGTNWMRSMVPRCLCGQTCVPIAGANLAWTAPNSRLRDCVTQAYDRTARYSPAWHSTASDAPQSSAWHSTGQHKTTQEHTAHDSSKAQHRSAQHSI